ncbi:FAD-dependent oxidoreductase, partial [candidate division KSB1 bacterium]|nr:FAD-dependent oxidoreductase [candidate division KSB1 bacterium]
MQRNLEALAQNVFDVLIIGGGIYGACAAWEAAQRGLSVALVEKDDFGGATSSNSLKIIHGGLRYLQHADFKRMRESIHERMVLMRIAPHLVHPLPCVMPTYGHALKGKEVMAVAMLLNDLIGF